MNVPTIKCPECRKNVLGYRSLARHILIQHAKVAPSDHMQGVIDCVCGERFESDTTKIPMQISWVQFSKHLSSVKEGVEAHFAINEFKSVSRQINGSTT